MTPMSAETFGGVHLYEINKLDLLLMYSQQATCHEGRTSKTLGALMNHES